MDTDSSSRASVRLAIQRLVRCFPSAERLAKAAEVTLETVSVLLEELTRARHEHANEELQNTDPDMDLAILRMKVEEEQRHKEREGPVSKNKGATEPGLCLQESISGELASRQGGEGEKPAKVDGMFEPTECAVPQESITQQERRTRETQPDFTQVPANLTGKAKNKARNRIRNAHHNGIRFGNEIAQPSSGFDSIVAGSNIASTFWQGVNVKADCRDEIRKKVEAGEKFNGITPLPYTGNRTYVADRSGLIFLFRSATSKWLIENLVPKVQEAATKFMNEVIWPRTEDLEKNLRGKHFMCCAGHDRNNKKVPSLSRWHRVNAKAIETFFAEGEPFHTAT
ncbi:hypothetical protein PQX77_003542 [Marasmius sp. AFHP31]|nr:hypothetical protein PQX77_003542 [Marasmius sp. AFHP31]